MGMVQGRPGGRPGASARMEGWRRTVRTARGVNGGTARSWVT